MRFSPDQTASKMLPPLVISIVWELVVLCAIKTRPTSAKIAPALTRCGRANPERIEAPMAQR